MAGAVARHVGARHVVITDINPLPGRHARPELSMQRGGSRILLLAATVFL